MTSESLVSLPSTRPRWLRAAGWLLVGVRVFFALFALAVAVETAAALVGLTEPAQARSVPPVFVAHAVTGAVALVAVSVQLGVLATPPRPEQRRLHRVLGRTYVVAAVVTSLLTVPVIAGFGVDGPTKAAFHTEALLWLATTLIAFRRIRAGRVRQHREWMIRSFALAAFFITFSLWDPLLAAMPMSQATTYLVAVVLGWAVNLVVAEIWIRSTRAPARREPAVRFTDAAS